MSLKKPCPARLQASAVRPQQKYRRTNSTNSPGATNTSGRISDTVIMSVPTRRSVLNDDTNIEEPRDKAWWKRLKRTSRDMDIPTDNSCEQEPLNIFDELDVEELSQENDDFTMNLSESSNAESIISIVLPQRKLFTEKENLERKLFSQFGTRETLPKLDKTNNSISDKSTYVAPKQLFKKKSCPKNIFTTALLDISRDKTTHEHTLTAFKTEKQVRNLFSKAGTKRINMFANFLVSESEDEIFDPPEIQQPKIFAFKKTCPSSFNVKKNTVNKETNDVGQKAMELNQQDTLNNEVNNEGGQSELANKQQINSDINVTVIKKTNNVSQNETEVVKNDENKAENEKHTRIQKEKNEHEITVGNRNVNNDIEEDYKGKVDSNDSKNQGAEHEQENITQKETEQSEEIDEDSKRETISKHNNTEREITKDELHNIEIEQDAMDFEHNKSNDIEEDNDQEIDRDENNKESEQKHLSHDKTGIIVDDQDVEDVDENNDTMNESETNSDNIETESEEAENELQNATQEEDEKDEEDEEEQENASSQNSESEDDHKINSDCNVTNKETRDSFQTQINSDVNEAENEEAEDEGQNNRSNVDSPDMILYDSRNESNSFTVQSRNTSGGKSKIITKAPNALLIQSFAQTTANPLSTSTPLSDRIMDSSAEGSGWDSHRVTRKTLRQTFGKDFTPRKSLRAMVMDNCAKAKRMENDMTSMTGQFPLANSTKFGDETVHPNNAHMNIVSRKETIHEILERQKEKRLQENAIAYEEVKNSLSQPQGDNLDVFKVPERPKFFRATATKTAKPKPKAKPANGFIRLESLPEEVQAKLKYKPPRRYQPRDAAWITNRLYKFLEKKLEPKYNYKSRVRAEKLVEMMYAFAKETRRLRGNAAPDSVAALQREMARLNIVTTYHDFFCFIHDFMPREVRVKVVPDIVNRIPKPRNGLFSNIPTDYTEYQ